MDDDKAAADKLPGNHGQFGRDNATEDYQPLEPKPPVPDQADAGRPG